jgi:hypothetical protein
LSSKSKNNRSLNQLLYKYSDRIRDRYLATDFSVALETDLETVILSLDFRKIPVAKSVALETGY